MNARKEFTTHLHKIHGIYPVPNEQQAHVKWYVELIGTADCLKHVSIVVTDIDVQWCDGEEWKKLDWITYRFENEFENDIKEKGFFGRDIAPTVLEINFENGYIKII